MAKPKIGKVGGVHETTLMLTPKATLEELAKAKRDTKKRTQSMNGTLGEKIATAVESKHLDRKAFSMACQLEQMDDERLHVTYFNLLYYMEALGVEKRATAQEEMFEAGDVRGDEPEGKITDAKPKADKKANGKKVAAADKEASNVTPIGKTARAVAEQAGSDFKSTH